MFINKEGIIKVENFGLKIGPNFTLEQLKSNVHFKDFEFYGSNDDHTRYRIVNAKIDDILFF